MNLTISILYIALGVLVTGFAFRDNFRKEKKITVYNIILLLVLAIFLIVGVWDTINRYADTETDKKYIVNTVKQTGVATDSSIGVKIGQTGQHLQNRMDSTNVSLLNSMPKSRGKAKQYIQKNTTGENTINENTGTSSGQIGNNNTQKNI